MRNVRNIAQQALLHYIARCCYDKDWPALHQIHVNRRQALQINRLSAFECNILGDLSSGFATFRVDFSKLKACLEQGDAIEENPKNSSGVSSRETDLHLRLCDYLVTLYRNNCAELLGEFDITPAQAEYLSLVPFAQMEYVADHFWDFVVIAVDSRRLNHAIMMAVSVCRWIRQCSQLIRADAPRELMTQYYGMSCELYAEVREMHGRQVRGRPRALTYDAQYFLYQEFIRQYRRYEAAQLDPLRQPSFFLDLYDAMGRRMSLREIWHLVQEWLSRDLQFRRVQRDFGSN